MPYPISDDFAGKQGTWAWLAPWDVTMQYNADVADLDGQQHVDLRSFRSFVDLIPVPQYPDLDVPPQSPYLTNVFQSALENKFGNSFTEKWITSGNGINEAVLGYWDVTVNYIADDIVEYEGRYYQTSGASLGDIPTLGAPWSGFFFVGKIAAKGGWAGLQVTTDGANLEAFLESSIPDDNIDISTQDTLSMLFPDFNTFVMANSTVELSSHPDGTFSDADYVSAAVTFFDSLDSMPHMNFTLTDFTTGAGSEFSLSKITGIQIYLENTTPPAASETITVMAIRALSSTWLESFLDFDTRWGILHRPVTLDGNYPTLDILEDFEFIRGDGTKNDPFPAEGAFTIFFYPGGETSPEDAQDPDENQIQLILREIKSIGDGTGSAIHSSFYWNDTDARFTVTRIDTTGGSPGVQTPTTIHEEIINEVLSPNQLYAWTVNLTGKSVYSELSVVNVHREIQNQVWTIGTPINDEDFTFRNGRVGFAANLMNRDAFVDALIQAPLTYAVFRTQAYRSRTPMDGVRLSAVYSPDLNLFTEASSSDLFIDQTKTVSGNGSYRTRIGITTNLFIVEDWLNTYLSIALWVPAGVTRSNQPTIWLDSGTAEHFLKMPQLQPAQWNRLHFDFGIFRDLITGLPYSLNVERARFPDKPLSYFWVDDIVIGRRKVLWSARALENAPFRRFNHLANQPKGAVHFNPDERGRDLQLQAEALTPDAWVISFDAFPHYAELGLPLYDQAFEIR